MKNINIENILKGKATEELNCKVLVAIPSTIKDQPAPKKDIDFFVDLFSKKFTKFFGGYRSNAYMKGGFYDWTTEENITEDNIDIYSYCTEEQLEENIKEVLLMVQLMKNKMDQTAIYIEVKNIDDYTAFYI